MTELKHRNGLYWQGWNAHSQGWGVTSTNRDWIDGWKDREATMSRLVSSAAREPEYFEEVANGFPVGTMHVVWAGEESGKSLIKEAPWTDEEVETLNAFQNDGSMHPFTCPGDYEECEGHRELVATCNGWTCQCGRYTQTWAHVFMTEKRA